MRSPERKVVITSTRDNFKALKGPLERRGFRAVHFPAIEISPLRFSIPEKNYDWVVFTSRNAVRAFAGKAGRGFFRGSRIAAIGAGTAALITEKGLRADFVHRGPGSAGFAAALSRRFLIKGKKFLLPVSSIAGGGILSGLAGLGGHPVALKVYRTVIPVRARRAAGRFARGGPYYFILFASPSAFENFIGIRGLRSLLAGTRTAAIGPVTAAAMRDRGVEPDIAGKEASFRTVVEDIIGYKDCVYEKIQERARVGRPEGPSRRDQARRKRPGESVFRNRRKKP